MTRCACGSRLLFHERVAFPQHMCFRCATVAGVTRTSDVALWRALAKESRTLPRWWRWAWYAALAIEIDMALTRAAANRALEGLAREAFDNPAPNCRCYVAELDVEPV